MPAVEDAAHVAAPGEPVLRRALISEAAVEALDAGVLHGLILVNMNYPSK
jgi:hypothetical protein